MKLFLCSSKAFYAQAKSIIATLEKIGHEVTPPNSFNDPDQENRLKSGQMKEYVAWKESMFKEQADKVNKNEAILVLNLEKEGKKNYIGGATFLEIFKAWELKKKIFLYNPIPQGILYDELVGMNPTIINGDLNLIQ